MLANFTSLLHTSLKRITCLLQACHVGHILGAVHIPNDLPVPANKGVSATGQKHTRGACLLQYLSIVYLVSMTLPGFVASRECESCLWDVHVGHFLSRCHCHRVVFSTQALYTEIFVRMLSLFYSHIPLDILP